MCDPVTLAVVGGTAGLGVASEVFSQRAQGQQAEAQAEAINLNQQQQAVVSAVRQFQENLSINQEELERNRQALRERARLNVAIGESGLVGPTTVRQLASSFVQENIDIGTLETQKSFIKSRGESERGLRFQEANRRVKAIRSSQPSRLFSAFKILNAGGQAGGQAFLATGGLG